MSNLNVLKYTPWVVSHKTTNTGLGVSQNTALSDLKCDDNKFDCKALKAKYNLE